MKRKNWLLFVYIFAIILFSYFILYRSGNASFVGSVDNILLHKKIQILTFFILSTFYVLLLSIFNSLWLTSSVYLIIVSIFSLANYEKVIYRKEGIVPSDMSMIRSIGDLFSMVGFKLILMFVIFMLIIVFASFFIFKKFELKISLKLRAVLLIGMVFLCYGYSNFQREDTIPSRVSHFVGNYPFYWNPEKAIAINGPVLNYFNNINNSAMDKPKGYSKSRIEKIVSKYNKKNDDINKTRKYYRNQKVIFILSESFSDPTRIPEVRLNHDPIPYTRGLMKSAIGGNMISDGYGGGTANMEYQELTGLSLGNFNSTMPTPYTQLVVKQNSVFSFNQLFENSLAIHPYNGNLYSRSKVFKKMKFNGFDYLNNNYPKGYTKKIGKNPYVSDRSAYRYLLSVLNDNGGNEFIQLTTMQNHMPYDRKYYENNEFKVSGNLTSKERQKIETYSKGIEYTDDANRFLINKLKKMDSKVTVVFYGDHLPGIYKNSIVKNNPVLIHETPYFIWTNHGELNKLGYQRVLGTYSLASAMLQSTGTKSTPYYTLIQDVSEELPVIASKISKSSGLSDPNLANGEFELLDTKKLKMIDKSSLTKKQSNLLKEYQLIQYDMTVGKHYSLNGMTK